MTLGVVIGTATVSIIGLMHPEVVRLLGRHPAGNEQPWRYWRLLTSLLVHDAWLPLVFNLIGLTIVGTAVERRVGAAKWALLYLMAGLVGEIAGVWWQPVGAGNSVASFGLVGGLLLLSVTGERTLSFGAIFAAEWIFVFAGLALANVRGAVIAGVLCCPLPPLAMRLRAHGKGARTLTAVVAALSLVVAFLLCAAHDIHGPPLLTGALVATMFSRRSNAE